MSSVLPAARPRFRAVGHRIAAYRKRLHRLRDGVARAARGCGGSYACVEAGEPAAMFREHLLPQGVLEPAR